MFIQCLLVITACTQHLLVLGSSTRNMVSMQKGKEQAGAIEKNEIFSMQAFVQYAKKIYKEAAKFQRTNDLLDHLSHSDFAITAVDPDPRNKLILDELIAMKGEFPKFAETDEKSSERPSENKQLRAKKKEILEKVKSDTKLQNSDDKKFVTSWAMDSLNEARSVVQSNFLNGKPDEATVALFNSVDATHLKTAAELFSKQSFYMMSKICYAISEMYKDRNYFRPSVNAHPFQTKRYKCQIGSNEVAKDLIDVGTCGGLGTSKLSYVKVALAKVQDIGSDGSFGIQYFIAFDKITKNPKKPGSWAYETYVAKSLCEKYEEPEKPKSKSQVSKKVSLSRRNA